MLLLALSSCISLGVPSWHPLKIVAGTAIVLVLPGLLTTWAIFSRGLSASATLLFCVCFSVAAATLVGALTTEMFGSLESRPTLLGLTIVGEGAGLVCILRAAQPPILLPGGWRPPLTLGTSIAFVASCAAVAAVTVVLRSTPTPGSGFTALAVRAGERPQIIVANHRNVVEELTLTANLGRRVVVRTKFRLRPAHSLRFPLRPALRNRYLVIRLTGGGNPRELRGVFGQ